MTENLPWSSLGPECFGYIKDNTIVKGSEEGPEDRELRKGCWLLIFGGLFLTLWGKTFKHSESIRSQVSNV